MKLNVRDLELHFGRQQISVTQDGDPIPYEWTGPGEITVDAAFERAAIQVTPQPLSADLRAPVESSPRLMHIYDEASAVTPEMFKPRRPLRDAENEAAILAERERCAKIAEDFRETTVDDRAALVDAIRNPK